MVRALDESGRARTLSLLRVARLETNWIAIGRGGDPDQAVAAMNRDLLALQAQSPALGIGGLCDAISRILAHLGARAGSLPQELDLLMTMAIQFVGRIVRDGQGGGARGLDGFLREVDEALREAGSLSERGPRESRSREQLIRVSSRWAHDLGAAATAAFLAHLFAEDAAVRPRLYEAWQALADEASRARAPVASRRVAVLRFRIGIAPVDVAVPAEWTPAEAAPPPSGASAIDLLGACVGTPALDLETRQRCTIVVLGRGGVEVPVFAASAPVAVVGDRLCPTGELHPAEVVLVGGCEVVLVRPDRAALQAARAPE